MTEETGAKIIACIIVIIALGVSYGIAETLAPGNGMTAVTIYGVLYSLVLTWKHYPVGTGNKR